MQIHPHGFKARVPPAFVEFVNFLRDKTHMNQNTIIGWGFSRGGKWLMEIVRNHTELLDVAVIFGGYPQTKCKWTHKTDVQELIAVKNCLVTLVHFNDDELCGPLTYPVWHGELARYMADTNRSSTMISMNVPGTHDKDARDMWFDWQVRKHKGFQSWFTQMEELIEQKASQAPNICVR